MRHRLWLVAVSLLAYGSSLLGSFHFDDYSLFVRSAITESTGAAQLIRLAETRPLTNLTFWLNFQLGGKSPWGYHFVNLALHLAAVLLLYSALRIKISALSAFWAAALFAVHPAQSEAVAYIFARSTLLCTALCLASLLLWLRQRFNWAVVLFALALLAKEECVSFPLVLLLFNFFSGRNVFANCRYIALMLTLSLLSGAHAIWATSVTQGSGAGFTSGISPLAYLSAQGAAIFRYMRLLILPWGFTIEPSLASAYYPLAWVAVLLLIAIASLIAWRKHHSWAIWVLAAFILLIPSSTIFPAADLAADRRMYLPMIGFAAAFGTLIPVTRPWAPSVLVAALSVLSIRRMETWRTERSLWEEASLRSPEHVRPLLQLSRAVPDESAVALLSKAESIEPRNAAVPAELGRLWIKMGRNDMALREFGRALALEPNNPHAINNRGTALLALKQEQAARLDFIRALKIDPCIAAARNNLRALGVESLPSCNATEK